MKAIVRNHVETNSAFFVGDEVEVVKIIESEQFTNNRGYLVYNPRTLASAVVEGHVLALPRRQMKQSKQDGDRYICWDCEKELGDLKFPKEAKQRCPKEGDGAFLVICKQCVEKTTP